LSGDDEFYQQYLAPLESRMLRSVHRLLRDPELARDALQDALVRIWRSRDVVLRHPRPDALLLRICINAAFDALRHAGRRNATNAAAFFEAHARAPGCGPEAILEDRERREAVLAALARLPRQQALAVLLHLVQEQPYAEVAEIMGCSQVTARIHVMRARHRLRRLLAPWAPPTGEGEGR
jgi:RNA polymerase sigma-70 factor (ECF subfamily)